MANAVEQSLLPNDLAGLKSMRKHEVFFGLKRDLVMVNTLVLIFNFYFLKLYFLPLLGHPSYVHGRGDGEQLSSDDEKGRVKVHCGHRRLQYGREKGAELKN